LSSDQAAQIRPRLQQVHLRPNIATQSQTFAVYDAAVPLRVRDLQHRASPIPSGAAADRAAPKRQTTMKTEEGNRKRASPSAAHTADGKRQRSRLLRISQDPLSPVDPAVAQAAAGPPLQLLNRKPPRPRPAPRCHNRSGS